MRVVTYRPHRRGQALAEFALVFPIFVISIMSVIIFGLFVFNEQQIQNVAREGARFAAVHSATAQCPTASWKLPNSSAISTRWLIDRYGPCDPPDRGWPRMTPHAKGYAIGMIPNDVHVAACWSGYHPYGQPANYDFPPVDDTTGIANEFAPCLFYDTVNGNPYDLPCPRMTTPSDDTGSSIPDNFVTVYACYEWQPPMAGLLFIPQTVTMRAFVTEVVQTQR